MDEILLNCIGWEDPFKIIIAFGEFSTTTACLLTLSPREVHHGTAGSWTAKLLTIASDWIPVSVNLHQLCNYGVQYESAWNGGPGL